MALPKTFPTAAELARKQLADAEKHPYRPNLPAADYPKVAAENAARTRAILRDWRKQKATTEGQKQTRPGG